MFTPEKWAELQKAEALKSGKTAEEAEAIAVQAKTDAEAKLKDPLYLFHTEESKRAFAERDAATGKIKEYDQMKARLKELEEKDMPEAERIKKRLAELEPFEAEARAARETFTTMLADAVKELTEEQKGLIPDGTPAEQYRWVLKAKAAGFGKKETPNSQGATLPGGGAPGNTIKRSELAKLRGVEMDQTRADIRAGKKKVIDG
jgi:hypothetical protein